MLKQVLMGLSALALVGAGYATVMAAEEKPGCCGGDEAKVVLADASTTAPAAKVDMKNTKCIVMKDDDAKSSKTVEHDGKVYHVCCKDCVKEFNKDPEKFVKAFEADPASYGVKK